MVSREERKKKAQDNQTMCPETASLWEKLHNLPYLLSHRWALILYTAIWFIINFLCFSVIMLIVGLVSTDVVLFLRHFGG